MEGVTGDRLEEAPLWDARDVARYLKKSVSWVYHAAAADEVPCRRIGGSLRFAPEEIHAFARGGVGARRVIVRPQRPAR
jgi:predicted DNA-binding transcriptional regulator AlpA